LAIFFKAAMARPPFPQTEHTINSKHAKSQRRAIKKAGSEEPLPAF